MLVPKPKPPARIKRLARVSLVSLRAEIDAELDLMLYPELLTAPPMNRGRHCEGNTK